MRPQRKMRGKDARGQARREQEWLTRESLQKCSICGRLFTRHVKDRVCSRDCLAKMQQQAKQQNAKGDATTSLPANGG
jgi:hypothetical protein